MEYLLLQLLWEQGRSPICGCCSCPSPCGLQAPSSPRMLWISCCTLTLILFITKMSDNFLPPCCCQPLLCSSRSTPVPSATYPQQGWFAAGGLSGDIRALALPSKGSPQLCTSLSPGEAQHFPEGFETPPVLEKLQSLQGTTSTSVQFYNFL